MGCSGDLGASKCLGVRGNARSLARGDWKVTVVNPIDIGGSPTKGFGRAVCDIQPGHRELRLSKSGRWQRRNRKRAGATANELLKASIVQLHCLRNVSPERRRDARAVRAASGIPAGLLGHSSVLGTRSAVIQGIHGSISYLLRSVAEAQSATERTFSSCLWRGSPGTGFSQRIGQFEDLYSS